MTRLALITLSACACAALAGDWNAAAIVVSLGCAVAIGVLVSRFVRGSAPHWRRDV